MTAARDGSAAGAPIDTMSGAVNQALDGALAEDPDVFLLGEDIEDPAGGVMKATVGLSTKYGRARVRGTPISEQAIVGTAIGASLAGLRPVAEVMLMDFFAVCMDQVANHAAKLRYMSGGPHARAHHHPHRGGRRPPVRCPALAVARGVDDAGARAQGGGAEHPGRRQGTAHRLHLRRRPVHLHGDHVLAVHPRPGAGRAPRGPARDGPRSSDRATT